MSLVAYESSDGSDNESEHEASVVGATEETPAVVLKTLANNHKQEANDTSTSLENSQTKNGLFSQLPAPKHITSGLLYEEPISRNIPKKETVKIRIPSLKEFAEEDEETDRIRRKPSKIGSGLMSMLPEPQNIAIKETAKQLVPLSVSRKPASVQGAQTPKPRDCLPKHSESATSAVTNNSLKLQDDNASDEETLTDFFSLSQTPDSELDQLKDKPSVIPNVDQVYNETKCDLPSSVSTGPFKASGSYFSNTDYSGISYNANVSSDYVSTYSQHNAYEATNSQQVDWGNPSVDSGVPAMKNEDFVRLAGKKRNAKESIEIVDVNGDDLVAGRDEWLLKSLSETNSYQPAPKRSDQPSAMHRRKHQITYLAFQAKAREQELKNQWSMNRMTKKQTQSKYGF